MSDLKGPEAYGILTYCWVIGLATWGGVARFFGKVKSGKSQVFNLTEFIGEICVSGLVGVCTFFLCEWAEFNQLFTAAAVGVTGHMGSRGLILLEKIMQDNVPKLKNPPSE